MTHDFELSWRLPVGLDSQGYPSTSGERARRVPWFEKKAQEHRRQDLRPVDPHLPGARFVVLAPAPWTTDR